MEEVFYFHRFSLLQDPLVFKVNTDGVLLGAWSEMGDDETALDVGTGTGLIALMLAQRYPSLRLLAIDNQREAVRLAEKNAGRSPWTDRVEVRYVDFLQFAKERDRQFDHIISNPPYFGRSKLPRNPTARQAKHIQNLTHRSLLFHSYQLTGKPGKLSMIIPVNMGGELRHFAEETGWHVSRECAVVPRKGKPANRLMIEFQKEPCEPSQTDLTLYKGSSRERSPEFHRLVSDFYVK